MNSDQLAIFWTIFWIHFWKLSAMPLRAVCSKCESKINAPDKFAGKRAKCPKCGNEVSFPKIGVAPGTPPALPDKANANNAAKPSRRLVGISAVGIIAIVAALAAISLSGPRLPSYSAALANLQMERAELDRLKAQMVDLDDRTGKAKQAAADSILSAKLRASGLIGQEKETSEEKEKRIEHAERDEERAKQQLRETTGSIDLELESLGKTIRLQYVKVADAERAKDAAYTREHPK